ncbi:hypothetical protein [Moritella viscosa]|uniref:ATP-binding protein n=1 Tax=Moritella viscosa TaxID=80854 RepID=A0A1L0B3V7_9GAMM|nr:hypothetical protein [Moritella viscosa]SGY96118.1 Putative uncharacterized protein [Moritella viscosa]
MRKFEQLNSRKRNLIKLREQKREASSLNYQTRIKEKNKQLFGAEIVDAPTCVDLMQGENSSCYEFFEKLKAALARNPESIYISFSQTKILKAMPVLVIYSIIDQVRNIHNVNTKIGIIWSKKSKEVNGTIKGSGLFLTAEKRETSIKDTTTLPVIMGDNARVSELKELIVDYILDSYFPGASAEKEQQISSAITETFDNVGRHAYPDEELHENKKWWFCCDRLGNNLFIVIYDAGVGIPDSLSENNEVILSRINALYPDEFNGSIKDSIRDDSVFKKWAELVKVKVLRKSLSDGQLIRAAMHKNTTSTDVAGHGQGSKSIKALISEGDERSFLLMFSNYGFYRYTNEESDNESNLSNPEYKVQGTLIQWSI